MLHYKATGTFFNEIGSIFCSFTSNGAKTQLGQNGPSMEKRDVFCNVIFEVLTKENEKNMCHDKVGR